MTRLELAKQAVSIVVSLGTSKIVKDIIKHNVETETVQQKVTVGSASVALGFMVGDATSNYTDAKIDQLVTLWRKARSK